MDIFGMGMGEIILVIIVAIMIWGPNKIPEIARTAGKFINTIKQTSSDLTSQINKEIEEVEQSTRVHAPPPASTPAPTASHQLPPPVAVSTETLSQPQPAQPAQTQPPSPPQSTTSGED